MGDDHTEAVRDMATDALAPVLGPGTVVTGLHPLTSGASRQSWVFEAGPEGGPARRYVLQREMIRPDPAAPPEERSLAMPAQAGLIEAADRVGVPVARTVAAGGRDAVGSVVAAHREESADRVVHGKAE